jgi:hypothetical protein
MPNPVLNAGSPWGFSAGKASGRGAARGSPVIANKASRSSEARYRALRSFFSRGDVSPSEKKGFGSSALTIRGRIGGGGQLNAPPSNRRLLYV